MPIDIKALEDAVEDLICTSLKRASAAADLLRDASASDVASLRTRLDALTTRITEDHTGAVSSALVGSGRIGPGQLQITLSADALAGTLDLSVERINREALDLGSAFTLRRRGAEVRLILEESRPEVDQTLLRNLAQGVAWFEEIKSGETTNDIAELSGTTRQRVSAMVDLAFLAPDLMQGIFDCRQPNTLASDQIIKAPIPRLWPDQRDLFGGL